MADVLESPVSVDARDAGWVIEVVNQTRTSIQSEHVWFDNVRSGTGPIPPGAVGVISGSASVKGGPASVSFNLVRTATVSAHGVYCLVDIDGNVQIRPATRQPAGLHCHASPAASSRSIRIRVTETAPATL